MIWIICYPRGDKSKLCISQAFSYEKDEYCLASRQEFRTREDAKSYAKSLAEKHHLKLERDDDEHDFLD